MTMDDMMQDLGFRPRPTPDRPFLGLTILVVEDSRFASEAMRLLCLRSGARIRRADCIAAAERHLEVYRPSVAIVDLGLPDGSGHELIGRLHATRPRVAVLLGSSGADDGTGEEAALAAGADGFLPKPIETLTDFQAAILAHLPPELRPTLPRVAANGKIVPDPITYREDLSHAVDLLAHPDPPLAYLRRFLLGVARSARDTGLEGRANALHGPLDPMARQDLRQYLSDRIAALPLAM
jgi:CheY-like chemotaxis protein